MFPTLRFHPAAWTVIIGTFLSRGVYFMVFPFLAMYLSSVQGMDPAAIGLILAVSTLAGTLSSFLGGLWSDRFGRGPVLIGSILIWCAVFALFAAADQPWHFFVLNALNGFCRNLFEPASRALLADVTPPEQTLHVFSARYYAINAGMSFGPLLGAFLGSSASTSPFYFTALVYALYGVALLLVIRRDGGHAQPQRAGSVRLGDALRILATDRFFRSYLLGSLFVYSAYSHLETTLSQYFGNHPDLPNGVWLYSVLLIANALCVMILQIPVTRLAGRFEPMLCVRFGALCFAAGLAGFGFFDSLVPLVLCMVLFTVGEILCFVVGDVVVHRHAPQHLRGTYYGASGLAFLGQSLGPWFGGWLLHLLGFEHGATIFALLASLGLLALPLFVAETKRPAVPPVL
ncbi:MDR family MFS transporter [Tumebacillus lacus]|uniref:MDR family MFS transporter n=1 Tax=Tumebacillus lacus TaxID=2995335 RepID=UPI002B201A47|nr:MFS transporter [Tumebacillus lacus]